MTAHAIAALYLGGIAACVLAGIVAYEVRDARRVIRQAPIPPRVVPSNVTPILRGKRVVQVRSGTPRTIERQTRP